MIEQNIYFPCDKCGICCTKLPIDSIYETLRLDNGICKYFNKESNLCSIYKCRSEICNVVEMYKYFKNILSFEDYIKMNIKACKILKEMK